MRSEFASQVPGLFDSAYCRDEHTTQTERGGFAQIRSDREASTREDAFEASEGILTICRWSFLGVHVASLRAAPGAPPNWVRC